MVDGSPLGGYNRQPVHTSWEGLQRCCSDYKKANCKGPVKLRLMGERRKAAFDVFQAQVLFQTLVIGHREKTNPRASINEEGRKEKKE